MPEYTDSTSSLGYPIARAPDNSSIYHDPATGRIVFQGDKGDGQPVNVVASFSKHTANISEDAVLHAAKMIVRHRRKGSK